MATNPLTDLAIRNAAARADGKPRKLADGGGLALWVLPSGKYWRWKYRFEGREKLLALGVYPKVKAPEARRLRDEARRLLEAGKDPGAERKAEKLRRRVASGETFEAIAREWFAKEERENKAPATLAKTRWLLDLALPGLGARPAAEITPPEVLAVLRQVEGRGRLETARRLRSTVSRVLRYAVATGRAESDPTRDLAGALVAPTVTHRAAVTDPASVGALLRALDGYQGQPATRCALRLAPLAPFS